VQLKKKYFFPIESKKKQLYQNTILFFFHCFIRKKKQRKKKRRLLMQRCVAFCRAGRKRREQVKNWTDRNMHAILLVAECFLWMFLLTSTLVLLLHYTNADTISIIVPAPRPTMIIGWMVASLVFFFGKYAVEVGYTLSISRRWFHGRSWGSTKALAFAMSCTIQIWHDWSVVLVMTAFFISAAGSSALIRLMQSTLYMPVWMTVMLSVLRAIRIFSVPSSLLKQLISDAAIETTEKKPHSNGSRNEYRRLESRSVRMPEWMRREIRRSGRRSEESVGGDNAVYMSTDEVVTSKRNRLPKQQQQTTPENCEEEEKKEKKNKEKKKEEENHHYGSIAMLIRPSADSAANGGEEPSVYETVPVEQDERKDVALDERSSESATPPPPADDDDDEMRPVSAPPSTTVTPPRQPAPRPFSPMRLLRTLRRRASESSSLTTENKTTAAHPENKVEKKHRGGRRSAKSRTVRVQYDTLPSEKRE
jgi:hypothetical protein